MLAFFNRVRLSSLVVGLFLLAVSFVGVYLVGEHAWLPLDEEILPIGGRLLCQIPWTVGLPLSYLLLILGSGVARLLMIRYVSGITRTYLPIFFVPLLLGGLGLGEHNLLPPLVSLIFLEFAFALILQTSFSPNLYSRVFVVSVLVGAASLFYLPALFFAYSPVLVLLNRNAFRLRGISLIVLGTVFVPSLLFFVSWLIARPIGDFYPISYLLTLSPRTMWHWTSLNPVRSIYMLLVLLCWGLCLWWVNYPHKVHKTTYLLVRNLLVWGFVVGFVAIFVVRDPFYILPYPFAFLAMMFAYLLGYSVGRRATLLFMFVFFAASAMHLI